MTRPAHGWGLATTHESGQVLDTWFPAPALGHPTTREAPAALVAAAQDDRERRVKSTPVLVEIDLDTPPADVPDAYLRLHLLSTRLCAPRSVDLTGLFGVLPNVVWTNFGPCAVDGFEDVRLALRSARGRVTVFGVDKFPRMTDYVVPAGVRIADADRVRLGAHLAAGTTVMHEGFVNFNAGTLGSSMVEGRISAGVVVGGLQGFVDAVTSSIGLGVILGLVAGKAIGITGSTWLVTRLRHAQLDPDLSWIDVFGLGVIGGIGFTVSLLVSELSFGQGSEFDDIGKVAILTASVLAALLAAVVLGSRNRHYRSVELAESIDEDQDGTPDRFAR